MQYGVLGQHFASNALDGSGFIGASGAQWSLLTVKSLEIRELQGGEAESKSTGRQNHIMDNDGERREKCVVF